MGVKEFEWQGFGDEAEETLSLCEFVINSTDGGDHEYRNDFSMEEQRSSSDQDFFEFSREGFTPSTCHTADNIIFCGKLIPYREPAVVTEKPQDPRKGCKQQRAKKIGRIFSWKTKSGGEKRDKFDFSVKEVSVLATPVKSRWYLFAFGVGRFPTEMELKDMKMRQNRKSRAAVMSQSDGGVEAVKDKQRTTGKGLWRLLKLLRRERRANAVVKASFG